MRRQILILPVLFLPLLLSFGPPQGNVDFITGDLPAVRARAEREHKFYFIHFTADWCLPCQWMEENTFQDVELAAYIHRHFLPVKLNIDHPEGSTYQKKYEVVTLPTILVFNSQGQLIDRHETSLDAAELMTILRSFRQDAHASPRVPAVSEPARVIPAPAATAPSRWEGHYSIQTGAYGEYHNAVAQARHVEQQVRSSASVFTTHHNGRAIYRVLIGRFPTEAEAARYLERIQQLGIQGFVKDTRHW